MASAKHFPGHGDTDLDSHLELPVVDQSRSRLEDVEIRPFKRAIEAGVATIMMAHVLYPELDPEYPASHLRRSWTASCAASSSTTAWC